MGFLNSRHFNHMTLYRNDEWIKKESSEYPCKIHAEYEYIREVSALVDDYFPAIEYMEGAAYGIQRLRGTTFTDLYFSGELCEGDTFTCMLRKLACLHALGEKCNERVYFSNKMRERRDVIFPPVTTTTTTTYNTLLAYYDIITSELTNYEPLTCKHIIHGDPTFSNILLVGTSQIYFIDPKGEWDGVRTIYGNKYYDYAKVLQCILGYDNILQDVPPSDHIQQSLLVQFTRHCTEQCLDIRLIYLLTASLYMTLVVFHEPKLKDTFLNKGIDCYNIYLKQ